MSSEYGNIILDGGKKQMVFYPNIFEYLPGVW